MTQNNVQAPTETDQRGHLAREAATLNVEGVTYRYPHFELGPIAFRACSNELVAIIGPNGSGKSTLLEVMSAHRRPCEGRVRLDGVDLRTLAPRRRAQLVGMARQETPLFFPFDVREFVRQGRYPHLGHRVFETEEDEECVDWALEKTDLVAFVSRRISSLSGGEFQRAILARTLAQRPRLVLLDEPTANLDIGYQVEMLRLLRELAGTEKFVAVMVTHELTLAAEMADYFLLLDRGRCLSQGTADQVLQAELLTKVFRTPVVIDRNPASGRPRVTWVLPR